MREIIRQKIIDSLAMELPSFIRRDIHVPKILRKAIAVIGPRRAGKTTFMWQLLAERLEKGMKREGLLFFGFEDERLAGMAATDLHLVVEEYYRLCPEWRDKQNAVFFFDEIQSVPGWETFARRLLDTEKVDLFLSGSSARLLSREVATSMRGRAMEALVLPFSFREYLRHHGAEPDQEAHRLPKSRRSAIDKHLLTYLECGGYPESLGVEKRDRIELLRGYVDTTLFRDIVERHKVSNPLALHWMVRQLLGNAGGTFSIEKFHRDLSSQGMAVGKDTLHEYLSHQEDAFLIRTVSIATESERRRRVNPRKSYPVDPGLIPVYDRTGKANVGHALETAVALELERRGAEMTYVRTAKGSEVDFLARFPEGNQELIQVCYSMDEPETRERETRALMEASEEHPRASLHLVTAVSDSAMDMPDNIKSESAAAWLLGTGNLS